MKPVAQIAGREIRLTYEQVQPDAEAIKNAYTKTLQPANDSIRNLPDWSGKKFQRESKRLQQAQPWLALWDCRL